MRGPGRQRSLLFNASSSGIRAACTTSVGRLTRTPRRVVRWKSFDLRILNDRGNTLFNRGQADSRVRPLRRRAEMIERPARVRIRRRKPWVRLRRRLLGWNVRLLTGKLPNPRSGRQFRYGAHTARIAGGASRWQRPLWKRPSNGTGHRQTGQTDVQPGRCKPGRRDLGGLNGCWASMSSGHTEGHGEYRGLACTATLRLLASRFASQFSLSYRIRR